MAEHSWQSRLVACSIHAVTAKEAYMFAKVIALILFVVLFGLIHYRNTYWKGQWEKKTKELR